MQVLRDALADEPHIAARVCDAIGKLAEGFKDYQGQSSPLSPFFKEIVTVLLQTAQRQDNKQFENMRMHISAFEAINDMVRILFCAVLCRASVVCMRAVRHVICGCSCGTCNLACHAYFRWLPHNRLTYCCVVRALCRFVLPAQTP